MYLTSTRPDMMYVVSMISKYTEHPIEPCLHPIEPCLIAAKRILRYPKETIEMGIQYKKGEHSKFVPYSDNDYRGDVDDRKSTSGYVFMLVPSVGVEK